MRRLADLLSMRPADAAAFFAPPKLTALNVNANTTVKLIGPNPARVVLMLSINGSGSGTFSPTGLMQQTTWGLNLSTGAAGIVLSFWQHGPLVTLGWDVSGAQSGTTTATAIEFAVPNWPYEDADPTNDLTIAASLTVEPATQPIPTAPSVSGRASLLDYWRQLMSQIKGKNRR